MNKLKCLIKRLKRKKIIDFLKNANPEKLEKHSEQKLLKSFRKVYHKVTAYKSLAQAHNFNINTVKSISDFKSNVPVIDKLSVFTGNKIHEIFVNGSVNRVKTIMSSSGLSGTFSFGIDTSHDFEGIAESIDTSLDYLFNISERKTLLISCVAMGVKVFTSVTLAETSVRSDMALAIIKKFSAYFDQVILVGDPYFIKKLVEEGISIGIDWKTIKSSFIFGEDWFSESFRSYVEYLTGIETKPGAQQKVVATMGITELDLNLFHETPYTIAIRKECVTNENLRKTIFGESCTIPPIIFHYFPHRYYLETIPNKFGDKELVFSMLSNKIHMPLIRYNSKDIGDIYSYNKLSEILDTHCLSHLKPDLKLPIVWVNGRAEQFIEHGNCKIYTNAIKQILFEDFEIARSITGYFRLSVQSGRGKIEIQLNRNISANIKTESMIKSKVLGTLPSDLEICIFEYQNFPYGMELDYEKKFVFI